MKQELIWWTGFVVVAVIVIGQMTAFNFGTIDIQLHDTYYVVPSWLGIFLVLIILGLLRAFTKLADRLSNRSRPLAIMISIINGLMGVVLFILICMAVLNLVQVKEWYPDLDISNYIGIIMIMISLLLLLTVIEIKTIKKVRTRKV
jgi:heme/copper-type cytochrome/quinol oxidase subunit 1